MLHGKIYASFQREPAGLFPSTLHAEGKCSYNTDNFIQHKTYSLTLEYIF